ncbi:MAG: hypothetical protein M1832_005805 [Thelocarpon impressellum]|nr:MAG: hypothetical protein M1832_005805 [Thelocarpon impressellum]
MARRKAKDGPANRAQRQTEPDAARTFVRGAAAKQELKSALPSSKLLLDISSALEYGCGIRHEAFALMILDEAGSLIKFTSPPMESAQTAIFSQRTCEEFVRAVEEAETNGRFQNWRDESGDRYSSEGSIMSIRESHGFERSSRRGGDPTVKLPDSRSGSHGRTVKRRKLSKRSLSSGSDSSEVRDEGPPEPLGVIPSKQLMIGDTAAVAGFYKLRFHDLQQLYCKVVAKAWIRTIEPRKQSTHPYKDGKAAAPDWWPEGVDHKEPDHIKKDTRLKLLLAIIRARRVPVRDLESATNAVLNSIHPDKRPILADIYRVAKAEERFLDGCIDGDTFVCVPPTRAKALDLVERRSPTTSSSGNGDERSEGGGFVETEPRRSKTSSVHDLPRTEAVEGEEEHHTMLVGHNTVPASQYWPVKIEPSDSPPLWGGLPRVRDQRPLATQVPGAHAEHHSARPMGPEPSRPKRLEASEGGTPLGSGGSVHVFHRFDGPSQGHASSMSPVRRPPLGGPKFRLPPGVVLPPLHGRPTPRTSTATEPSAQMWVNELSHPRAPYPPSADLVGFLHEEVQPPHDFATAEAHEAASTLIGSGSQDALLSE